MEGGRRAGADQSKNTVRGVAYGCGELTCKLDLNIDGLKISEV